MKYIVFFPGEVNYYYYFESELCLCSDTVDTIFSTSGPCCFRSMQTSFRIIRFSKVSYHASRFNTC